MDDLTKSQNLQFPEIFVDHWPSPRDSLSYALSAGVIQLVECQLPKLDVAGSSPVARSCISKATATTCVAVAFLFVHEGIARVTIG